VANTLWALASLDLNPDELDKKDEQEKKEKNTHEGDASRMLVCAPKMLVCALAERALEIAPRFSAEGVYERECVGERKRERAREKERE